MYLTAFLYSILIVVTPAIIILAFIHYLFRREFDKYLDLKFPAASTMEVDQLFPQKLHAHERMIVFVERLNPSNVLVRLHQQGISVKDLQSLVMNEINTEYQHNITQQLYITDATWNVIRKLKEDTLAMISNAAAGLNAEATGLDLSKKVLQHMAMMEENPYDLTLSLIKKDIYTSL